MLDYFKKHNERHKAKGTGFMFEPTQGDKKANCLTARYSKIGATDTAVISSKGVDDLIICHSTQPRSSKLGTGGTGPLSRNDGKSYCLDTGNSMGVENQNRIRRLTPKECCRLQTVPDTYFDGAGISQSQQYKALGNGWTIDVIVHILNYIK